MLALLVGYFFFWRPIRPPPILTPIQEKTISDLEAVNKKAAEERELLRKQAQEATGRATRAITDAAKDRIRLRELETQLEAIKAKRGTFVTDEAQAMKELKAMGWLR